MQTKLMGVFAPITTPFSEDGRVDIRALASNVRRYASTGLKGYLALGSNGENKSLTNEEKLQVLETIIQNKGQGQTVIAGCIFESTYETLEMARLMEALGPDYLTLLPPSYFKKQMTDEVLYQYFCDVADAVNTPCLLYNAPQYAGGVSLSTALIARCAGHPNIVGVKDSSTGNIESILFAVRDRFSVLSGTINNFFPCMTMGGLGGVLSLADSFPEQTVEFYSLLRDKRYEKAIACNDLLLRVNRAIGGAGGVAAVKCAMTLNGYIGGLPRAPLMPLDEGRAAELKDKLVGFHMLSDEKEAVWQNTIL